MATGTPVSTRWPRQPEGAKDTPDVHDAQGVGGSSPSQPTMATSAFAFRRMRFTHFRLLVTAKLTANRHDR